METVGPDTCPDLDDSIISPAQTTDSETKSEKKHVGVCLLFVISSLINHPVLLGLY